MLKNIARSEFTKFGLVLTIVLISCFGIFNVFAEADIVDDLNDVESVKTPIVEEPKNLRVIEQGDKRTFQNIRLNEEYAYPLNQTAKVKFSQFDPEVADPELVFQQKQVVVEGQALEAFEISSNMTNGKFLYDLTLPNTAKSMSAEVKYSEDGGRTFTQLNSRSITPETIKVRDLDHFTIFVVVAPLPTPAVNGDLCEAASVNGICYDTISGAIQAASSGDEIYIANGNYTVNSTLNISKSLTIRGESQQGVVIDMSLLSGYGFNVVTDNVTIENLTIKGPIADSNANRTFKFGNPMPIISNGTLRNITVTGGNRTPFDIHGVDGFVGENLTATGTPKGVGLSLSGVKGAAINGFTGGQNTWGDIAIFASTYTVPQRGSSQIVISDNSGIGGVYVEDTSAVLKSDLSSISVGSRVAYYPNPAVTTFYALIQPLDAPVQTGYNSSNTVPANQKPAQLACGTYANPAATNLNRASALWNWEGINTLGQGTVKYQRQFSINNNGAGWTGSEIYTDKNTNYRTFGSGVGTQGIYGSRVRAFVDLNNNNAIDTNEIFSAWSNSCYILFDNTAPQLKNIKMFVDGTENAQAQTGQTIKIEADFTDNLSGLQTTEIKLYKISDSTKVISTGNLNCLLPKGSLSTKCTYEFVMPDTYLSGEDIQGGLEANAFSLQAWDRAGNISMVYLINFTFVPDHAPVVTLDRKYAFPIQDNYSCGLGSYLDNDGLRLTVLYWKSSYKLQYLSFAQGNRSPYDAESGWTDWNFNSPLVEDGIAVFNLAHTGNAPEGPAGWKVRVVDTTKGNLEIGNRDFIEYEIINNSYSQICGGPDPLGVERYALQVCKEDIAGQRLDGWEINLDRQGGGVSSGQFTATNATGSTVGDFPAGQYEILVSGTYRYHGSGYEADAGYSYRPRNLSYSTQTCTNNTADTNCWVSGDSLPGNIKGFLEVQINGQNVQWGNYTQSHTYNIVYNHTGGPMRFSVRDDGYADNRSGTLLIEVFGKQQSRVSGSLATDVTGCTTFDGLLPGEYRVSEIQKEGWAFISRSDEKNNGDSIVLEGDEQLTFVNKQLEPLVLEMESKEIMELTAIPSSQSFVIDSTQDYKSLICDYLSIPENSVTNADSAVYEVKCELTDEYNRSVSRTAQLTIKNNPPKINSLQEISGVLTPNITLGDPDYSYSWSGNCSSDQLTFSKPATPGNYTCTFKVTDADGDSDSIAVVFSIPSPTPSPQPAPDPTPVISPVVPAVQTLTEEPNEVTVEETDNDLVESESNTRNQQVLGAEESQEKSAEVCTEDLFPWWIVLALILSTVGMFSYLMLAGSGKSEEE